jgi:rubrerythrin
MIMKNGWKISDIKWRRFSKSRVDPDILNIVKGASLVEYNAPDYGIYLNRLFKDDPEFQKHIEPWVEEEIKHGLALGRWAQKADPTFNLEASLKRFQDLFRIPLEAEKSIRGSNTGELIARCIVETGTSSFYSALGDASEEPVLKEICYGIAADEFSHYKLFYTHLKRYLKKEGLSKLQRLKIALSRIRESESDELASAYYAANAAAGDTYHHKSCSDAYLGRVHRFYRPIHVQRALKMVCKAAGLSPRMPWITPLSKLYLWISSYRYKSC